MIVLDASVVVTALVSTTPEARWAEGVVSSGPLAAPHLLHVEAAQALRGIVLRGEISSEAAGLAYDELMSLAVELYDYEGVAERIWALRGGLSAYDAWYVALAEELDVPLATLDRRLARSPGLPCRVLAPDRG